MHANRQAAQEESVSQYLIELIRLAAKATPGSLRVDPGPDRRCRLTRPAGGAVLFIDLDKFKSVNDAHGHAGGDAVLVQVAAEIRNWTQVGGITGRLGGDEFAVALPAAEACYAAAAACSAHRLLDQVRRLQAGTGPVVPTVGASVGVGLTGPGRPPVLGQLLKRADFAMSCAERSRGGWVLPGAGTGPDPAGPGTGHPRPAQWPPMIPPSTAEAARSGGHWTPLSGSAGGPQARPDRRR